MELSSIPNQLARLWNIFVSGNILLIGLIKVFLGLEK
jgi:hypothetical protein